LVHGGVTYTAKEAIDIIDQCALINQLPTNALAGAGMGAVVGQRIERNGLVLDWPTNLGARKASWVHTCALFERSFNTENLWENLDKWPN
jgi:hypothetical protein